MKATTDMVRQMLLLWSTGSHAGAAKTVQNDSSTQNSLVTEVNIISVRIL